MILTMFPLLTTFWMYLDPGSGSLLIQFLLGALLGAGLLVLIFWKRIKALFVHSPAHDGSSSEDSDDPHQDENDDR
jgi:hypothetical protein